MSFEIENKKCEFKRITTQDGLIVKDCFMILAKENQSLENTKKANETIDKIALKYLVIDGNSGFTFDSLDLTFENPFVMAEISAQFMAMVQGFLSKLPTFQNLE